MDRRIIGIVLFVLLLSASIPLVTRMLGEQRERRSAANIVQTFTFDGERQLHISARQVQPLMRAHLGLYYHTETAPPEKQGGDPAEGADGKTTTGASPDDRSRGAGAPRSERAFFGTLPKDRRPPRFVAHVSADREVVGIAASSDPGAILILHDFSTGESWPRHAVREGATQLEQRGRRLLAQLKGGASKPNLHLVKAEGLRRLDTLIEVTPASTQPSTQPGTQPGALTRPVR